MIGQHVQAAPSQEQQLLLSREARSSDRLQHRHNSQALHAFWAQLRSRLSEWNEALEALDETLQGNTRQELEDLKQRLHNIRKHCLASTICFDDWEVPDVPVGDLRLLHIEFTKCSTKWEEKKELLAPKGKFFFRRYREEVARRRSEGISLEEPGLRSQPAAPSTQASAASADMLRGACLQNISNASIKIDGQGNVHVEPAEATIVTVPATSLLMRNLQNCSVTIEKPMQALHVVNVSKTSIRVQNPITSAIHVTECKDCSIRARSQQLRIHNSIDLKFHVDLVAGAILEECSNIVFVADKIDVNDFNWLRTGIPSPNFRIEPPTPIASMGSDKSPTSDLFPTSKETLISVNKCETTGETHSTVAVGNKKTMVPKNGSSSTHGTILFDLIGHTAQEEQDDDGADDEL